MRQDVPLDAPLPVPPPDLIGLLDLEGLPELLVSCTISARSC